MRGIRRTSPEDAFQAALEAGPGESTPGIAALVKVAAALAPESLPQPSSRFKARLHNELLVMAATSEEDVFAAMLDGDAIAPPDELVPLARLAAAVATGPAARPLPNPQFRYQLRNRLMDEAARPSGLRDRVAGRFSAINDRMRRSLRTVGATGLAASIALSSGAALAASHNALPGDPLYGVKRFREAAQLAVVSGATEGLRLLDFARTRLGEVRGLADHGETTQNLYIDTLDDMDQETVDGTSLLIAAFREDGVRSGLERAASFARIQEQDLAALLERLPPGVRPAARDSLVVVQRAGDRALLVLAGCPCPDNALVQPVTEAAPAGPPTSTVGCDCPATTSSGDGQREPPSGTSGTGDGGQTGGGQTGGGGGEPETGRLDSVPDVPGTTADDEAKQTVDDLLDQLGVPSQLPLPGTTSVPTPSPSISLPVEPTSVATPSLPPISAL